MTIKNAWCYLALQALAAWALHPGQAAARPDERSWLPPAAQVEAAIKTQPEIHQAVARLDAAAATQSALQAGNHEFEWSTGLQRRDVTGEASPYNEWEIQVSRALRLPNKARLDRDIGSRTRGVAEMRLEDAEHQTARRLLMLWAEWLRSSIVADEMQGQDSLLRREQEATSRRVALGDAALRDSEVLQAESAMLAAQLGAARSAALAARQTLAIEFPGIEIPASPPALPDPDPLPGGAQHWQARIVQQSVEIGIAEGEAVRLARVAERARANRTPDPTFGVRMMSERGGAERVVGVVMTVPFGTDYRAAVAATDSANAAAAEAEAIGVRRTVEQGAWAAVQAADSKRTQWQAVTQALVILTTASHRTERAWELGEASLSEHLLTVRNLRQTRLAEAMARVDALEASALVRIDAHELWHSTEVRADGAP
jgi:outer membrane protein TolC